MSKITEEQIVLFKKYYLENKSLREIGRLCGCESQTVKRYLLKCPDISLKSGYDCTRKVTKNPFLDLNNQETLYWLGWLASDGCVTGNSINLELAEDSMDVLENYKNFLGERTNVEGPFHTKDKGQNSYCVRFQNKEIANYLDSIGITRNKSKTIEIKFNVNWDFIRGVFEGDGTVYRIRPKNVGFEALQCNIVSASELFINQLYTFIKNEGIKCSINNELRNNVLYKRLWISYTDSYKFFKLMYYSEEIPILSRKYNKFNGFFTESNNNYQLYTLERISKIKYTNKMSALGIKILENTDDRTGLLDTIE